MSGMTDTTSKWVFSQGTPAIAPDGPNKQACFHLQDDPNRPGLTRITLPPGSTYTPGPHWHEQYIEHFKVLEGRVLVRLDGYSKIVTATDPSQQVDKFVIHEFMRADMDATSDQKDDGDVVIEEWTDPADGTKHVMFRNLFSTLEDAEKYWKSWMMLQALRTCA
ncbi:hypothetical protein LTR66_016949, partial [Elasticomyces elasticus]